MVSLMKAEHDDSDPELKWLKAQPYIVNIATGSLFFFPFSFCGLIETLWLDLSHLFPFQLQTFIFLNTEQTGSCVADMTRV